MSASNDPYYADWEEQLLHPSRQAVPVSEEKYHWLHTQANRTRDLFRNIHGGASLLYIAGYCGLRTWVQDPDDPHVIHEYIAEKDSTAAVRGTTPPTIGEDNAAWVYLGDYTDNPDNPTVIKFGDPINRQYNIEHSMTGDFDVCWRFAGTKEEFGLSNWSRTDSTHIATGQLIVPPGDNALELVLIPK